jgi:exonuclease III
MKCGAVFPDPDDSHSRYIEAAINGVLIGGLYLPNGNPRPGPKFDYKLRRFEGLIDHAAELLEVYRTFASGDVTRDWWDFCPCRKWFHWFSSRISTSLKSMLKIIA